MSEYQFIMLTNILTDPYTWLVLGFIISVGYILRYIRRLYPKSLQEAMEKEEACTLRYQKNPEIKLIRKIINMGLLSMLFISYILSFHVLTDLVNPLYTFMNIFLSGAVLIIVIGDYYKGKIKKDKSCNNVIVGYKFIKIVGIIEILFILFLYILYLLGYIE